MLYETLPKAAIYSAALFAVGLSVAHALLLSAGTGTRSGELAVPLEFRLRRCAFWAAAAAMTALMARAWAHTAAAFGPAEAMQWENLRLIALESRWGGAWRWQVLAAAGLVAAGLGLSRWSRRGWILYALASVTFCSTIPLLGHAAGSRWRMVLHACHLLAGGVWLGTLAAIAALFPSHGTGKRPAVQNDVTAEIVRRLWIVALPGAATVAITGLVLAVLYVATPFNLIMTSYGQALLLKLAGVAGVVWCGRTNWQRARAGDAPSAPLILTELGFAAWVVATTTVLTELEHP